MRARFALLFVFAVGFGAACNAGNFEAESKVDTVRILASMADQPYAQPDASVKLTVLDFDGRPSKPEVMGTWWLPIPCINPKDDEYYQCFRELAGDGGIGGDAGADAGTDSGSGAGRIGPGVDLTPYLVPGTSFSLTLPPDIITSHPPPIGVDKDPYGLAIAFNMACAGHIEIIPLDPSNLSAQQVPVGCF